jgi:hypothetical protein
MERRSKSAALAAGRLYESGPNAALLEHLGTENWSEWFDIHATTDDVLRCRSRG